MPAHGSPQDAHVVSRPTAAGDPFAPPNQSLAQRVVSVSPHALDQSMQSAIPLIAQHSLDDGRAIADSLHVQIEQAGAIIERLSALAANASTGEAQAAQAVVHLQDRLRLGAQMIQAFQSQIGRIDHSLESLKAQERRAEAAEKLAQQRLAELNARIDATLADFTQRVEHVMHAAQEKMNRMVDERAAASAARSLSHPASPTAIMPATELIEVASSMHDVAQRLAELCTYHVSTSVREPEIHVSATPHRQMLASSG